MTSAAANGHPSSLLVPDKGQRVEMEPAPIYEDEKTLRNRKSLGLTDSSSSEGHGDVWSASAILKGDAGESLQGTSKTCCSELEPNHATLSNTGHNIPVTPFEMKAALVNAYVVLETRFHIDVPG